MKEETLIDIDPHALTDREYSSLDLLRSEEIGPSKVVGRPPSRLMGIPPPGNTDAQSELSAPPEEELTEMPTVMNTDVRETLRQAAARGDWRIISEYAKKNEPALRAAITDEGMTVLHLAARHGHSELVEKLVKYLPEELLAKRDIYGRTALQYVALVGTVRAAQAMVEKNRDLPQIADTTEYTPLFVAAQRGRWEMVWYLAPVTNDEAFTGPLSSRLILGITNFSFYDLSLYFLKRNPKLAAANYDGETILFLMAKDPSSFQSGSKLGIWDHLLYPIVPVAYYRQHKQLSDSPRSVSLRLASKGFKSALLKFVRWSLSKISNVHTVKLRHKHSLQLAQLVFESFKANTTNTDLEDFYQYLSGVMHLAIRNGVLELVQECLKLFPNVLWYAHERRLFLHVAIENRQVKIFNYLIEFAGEQKNSFANVIAEKRNNILHLAAKLAPFSQLHSISGSALQMQRELQWFKEVEKLVRSNFKLESNEEGQTPQELFIKEHKELQENGEKWMKDTSNSCMLVATLIATVVFTSMITVPGGINSERGVPIFLAQTSFAVFSISNALALLLSMSSVQLFLSILTSSYGEDDFLKSLPRKLMAGLALLLFAIAAVMIAFAQALQIAMISRFRWIFIIAIIFISVPVGLFAFLQLLTFVQILQSTCGRGIFHRQSDRWLQSRIAKLFNLRIAGRKSTKKLP